MIATAPMLKARARSGLLMGAALFSAAFLVPPWGAGLIVMAVAALGLREFYHLLEAARIPSFKIVGTLCGLALIAAPGLTYDFSAARATDGTSLALFLSAVAIFARMLFQRNNPRPLETLAGTLMGLLYVAFLISFFLRIAIGWGGLQGRWMLMYMITVVKVSDIGAYFVGCRFGRRKLFPRISPAKSWEGTLGGVCAAVAVSLAIFVVFRGSLGPVRWRLLDAVLLGLLLAVFGIFGDLFESLMKRAAGVKDSGALIAGMGGVLDVIDSLLPAAPVMYFYARFVLAPAL